jgi:chaperonin GroES
MTETLTKLVQGIQAEYVPAQWDGKDTSGVRVVGKTVLVLTDEVAEIRDSGIQLPIDYRERMNASCETGVLVAISPGAFLLNEDMTPWSGYRPQPGDRVYIEKYAGKQVKGRDGETYRIMDYGSIGATYEADSVQKNGG